MGAIAFFLRAILLLFIVRLGGVVLRAFLGGYLQGVRPTAGPDGVRPGGSRPSGAPRGEIEELVRDPICGVHTAMSSAIAGRFEGRSAYFCSPGCAAKAQAAS